MTRFVPFLCRLLTAAGLAAAVNVAMAADEHTVMTVPLTQAPDARLIAVTVSYRPGQYSRPHHHQADAFVYVIAGHVRSQVGTAPARVYGPGESWFEPAGMHHPVCGNASATVPATMLVVFVARPQARLNVADQSATPSRTHSR